MNILYFHQYFTTPKGSGGVRSYEFSRRWIKAGHDVHVITGTSFDATLPKNGSVNIEGIHVRTIGASYKPEMGVISRLGSFLNYAIKATLIAFRSHSYDLVLATSTPLTVAMPAIVAKMIAGRKVVFEVRDVWPDAAVDAGVLKNPLLIFFARLLEKAAYACSDHIVPLSSGMKKRIEDKGIDAQKMTMIPNCSDITEFNPRIDGNGLRKQFQAEGKFIVFYGGAVNLANNVEYIVHVAEILKTQKDVVFWIVGKGNRYSYLESEAQNRSLENVVLHGLQPKERIPFFSAAADAGIVTFIPEPVFYENSPNKFFDYIAAGLPVLFNRSTWLETYLDRYQNGMVCDPLNPQTMADRIMELKNDPERCRRMGAQSRKLAEDVFSRDKMAGKYIQIFESLTHDAD